MRALPQDIEAEKALISTACAPGNERVAMEFAGSFNPEAFADPTNRFMWESLVMVVDEKLEVNPFTLKDALSRTGNLGRVGGFQGIVDRLSYDEVGNPEVLIGIIERKWTQRRLISLGTGLATQAWNEDSDPEELMNSVSDDLLKMVRHKDDRGLQHIGKIAPLARQSFEKRVMGERIQGVYKTRWSRLDAMLGGGFAPGNLIILAARPGIGKSAMVSNWVLNGASSSDEQGAGIFNLEMSREEVTDRFVAAHLGVSLRRVVELRQKGKLPEIAEGYKYIEGRPIWICDQADITVREIKAMVENHIIRNGRLELVVVDYLQLISSPREKSKNPKTEALRIGEISRALKLLAKDHQIPVIVLSQLNREIEKREGGMPQLSDLRDSGSIEQDADIVMFIHRKAKPKKKEEAEDNSATLFVAKHRNGPTGAIPLAWDGSTTRYVEVDRHTDEPILEKKGTQVHMGGWDQASADQQEEPSRIEEIGFPDY